MERSIPLMAWGRSLTMNKVRDRELREAWQRFDRVTAYGCAARQVPYDPKEMRVYWVLYLFTLGTPTERGPYGDSRDD